MAGLDSLGDRRHSAASTPHALHVRAANLERVLAAALARPGSFTRADLMADTGLSAPTIGSLVSDLIKLDLLRQLGGRVSGAGRPASMMEFNARCGFVAAIDIGPTRTRLGIIDLREHLLAHRLLDTPATAEPLTLLDRFAQALRDTIASSGLRADRLMALSVGVPGIVNERAGVLVSSSCLPAWRDVRVRDVLDEAFTVPVLVDSDVNLALFGEHQRGAARGHRSAVFIRVTTGVAVSAAAMVDGQRLRGDHFRAGHIGFMCMGPQFVSAASGEHGSLDLVAGLRALGSRVSGDAAADPAAWIADVLDAAEGGDAAARGAVLETARFIGIAAANAAAMVDPSVIVLGGALFAHAPRLVGAVSAVVQSIWPEPVSIVLSPLEAEAPLWGGLLAALDAAKHRIRCTLFERLPDLR